MKAAKNRLQKKRASLFWQRLTLQICQWILFVAPMVALIIVNREKYFTMADGIKLSIGAVLGTIIFILTIKGKTKFLQPIWWLVIIFILCMLLNVILEDLKWFVGAALIGTFFYNIFALPIKKMTKIITAIDSANINAEAMSETQLNVIINGGD